MGLMGIMGIVSRIILISPIHAHQGISEEVRDDKSIGRT
jgi:hypothetical protein